MSDEKTEGGPVVERATPTAAPAADFGKALMHMLTNPEITADKLEAVMKVRREMIQDEARENYQFNFAEFSKELPVVERDGIVDMGDKGKFPFTTYEQMDKVLRPLLTKHGFSLQFWSSDATSKDVIVVHGALIGHGWQRESVYPVPPDTGPGRNALQARGSAQQYAKRYIADLLCNVVRKGKDDDGRGAAAMPIDPAQVRSLDKLLKETKTDEKQFLSMMVTGADTLGDIRSRDYPRLLQALRDKKAKQAQRK